MFDLKTMVDEKQNRSAQWVEDKQKEREDMSEMLQGGVEQATTSPEHFGKLMEFIGNVPHYSVGNSVLIMQQRPDATRVGGMKFWNDRGRSVIKGESGIKIFAREYYNRTKQVQDVNENTGEVSTSIARLSGVGYNVTRVFDIKQTKGKDLPAAVRLEGGTEKMGYAIKGLIEATKAQVQVDNNLTAPARYEQDVMIVFVRDGEPSAAMFQSLATEIAHANIHDGGGNPDYQRADYQLIAESISYSLCVRYGVLGEKPDFSQVPEMFEGFGHEDKLDLLNSMRDLTNDIGTRVDREMNENVKQLPAKTKPQLTR